MIFENQASPAAAPSENGQGPGVSEAQQAQQAQQAQVAGIPLGVVCFAPKGAALSVVTLDGKRRRPVTAVPAGSIVAIIPPQVAHHMLAHVPPALIAAATIE